MSSFDLTIDGNTNIMGAAGFPGTSYPGLQYTSSGWGSPIAQTQSTSTGLFGVSSGAWANLLGGVASGLQAGAQIAQGYSNYEMAKFNAAQYELQARLSNIKYQNQEKDFRRQAANLLGSQRVAFAKAGVVNNSGTAADVQMDTAYQLEQDALRIKYNGLIAENQLRQQALMQRIQGKSALTNGFLSGLGSFLTGYVKLRSLKSDAPVTDTTGYDLGGYTTRYEDFGWSEEDPFDAYMYKVSDLSASKSLAGFGSASTVRLKANIAGYEGSY